LKTPLTSIQGLAQALSEGATQGEVARKRAADIIYEEATRLRRLIEDLLDLASINAGQVVIGKQPINLTALLDLTLNNLSAQAKIKEVALIQAYRGLPNVVGDGDRLIGWSRPLPILWRMLSNIHPGGSVTLQGGTEVRPVSNEHNSKSSTPRHKQFARVAVADTGPGMEPEDLARIFGGCIKWIKVVNAARV